LKQSGTLSGDCHVATKKQSLLAMTYIEIGSEKKSLQTIYSPRRQGADEGQK